MEAILFFILFGVYICIRVLLGGRVSSWEKQKKKHQGGIKTLEMGNVEAARFYFQSELQHRPYDAFVLVTLGEIALLENNPERALAFGQRALRLENGIEETHLLLCKGLHAIGEFELAVKSARNALRFGSHHVEPNRWMGLLLLESGQMMEGIAYLEKSYELLETEHKPSYLQKAASRFYKS